MTETAERISIEQLQALVRNKDEFTTFFKKHAAEQELGKGEWKQDGKRGWRLTLLDGSYIRLKFFDTVKRIYNSKNVEVLGRESYLSYIDVAVMPAGMKGYSFLADISTYPWKYTKGKPPAKELHDESIAQLYEKAKAFGIDLSADDAWEIYYVRP